MSSATTLSRPYARAAFELAREHGRLAEWQDMLALASALASDTQVAGVLENPLVSPDQAVGLLVDAAGGRFDAVFGAFLGVLGENRRLSLLPEITRLFQRLKQDAEKRLTVRVVSAVPLTPDQAQRMSDALARRFGRAIELDPEVDGSVLGGAVIYAGDEVIDGSLRGRLQKLSAALVQ